jgi:hypothetical protein
VFLLSIIKNLADKIESVEFIRHFMVTDKIDGIATNSLIHDGNPFPTRELPAKGKDVTVTWGQNPPNWARPWPERLPMP